MSLVAFDKLCWAFHIISSEKVILYFFCKFVLFQKYRSVLERQNILAIYSNNQRQLPRQHFLSIHSNIKKCEFVKAMYQIRFTEIIVQ